MNHWSILIDKFSGRRIAYLRFKTPRRPRIFVDIGKIMLRDSWWDRLSANGNHLREAGKGDTWHDGRTINRKWNA